MYVYYIFEIIIAEQNNKKTYHSNETINEKCM